jgi:hypothetical protein
MSKVSAGEIVAGMYIVVQEVEYPRLYTCSDTGKTLEETVLDKIPWFRGIPFRVMNVMGPMVAVDTLGLHKGLARITIFDKRFHRFLEVTEEYHRQYVETMRSPKLIAQKKSNQ